MQGAGFLQVLKTSFYSYPLTPLVPAQTTYASNPPSTRREDAQEARRQQKTNNPRIPLVCAVEFGGIKALFYQLGLGLPGQNLEPMDEERHALPISEGDGSPSDL
jgi:hypothetical protein